MRAILVSYDWSHGHRAHQLGFRINRSYRCFPSDYEAGTYRIQELYSLNGKRSGGIEIDCVPADCLEFLDMPHTLTV